MPPRITLEQLNYAILHDSSLKLDSREVPLIHSIPVVSSIMRANATGMSKRILSNILDHLRMFNRDWRDYSPKEYKERLLLYIGAQTSRFSSTPFSYEVNDVCGVFERLVKSLSGSDLSFKKAIYKAGVLFFTELVHASITEYDPEIPESKQTEFRPVSSRLTVNEFVARCPVADGLRVKILLKSGEQSEGRLSINPDGKVYFTHNMTERFHGDVAENLHGKVYSYYLFRIGESDSGVSSGFSDYCSQVVPYELVEPVKSIPPDEFSKHAFNLKCGFLDLASYATESKSKGVKLALDKIKECGFTHLKVEIEARLGGYTDTIDFSDKMKKSFKRITGNTIDSVCDYFKVYHDGSVDIEATFTCPVAFADTIPVIVDAFSETCAKLKIPVPATERKCSDNAGLHIALMKSNSYPLAHSAEGISAMAQKIRKSMYKMMLGFFYLASPSRTSTRCLNFRRPAIGISSNQGQKYSAIYTCDNTLLEFRIFDPIFENPVYFYEYIKVMAGTLKMAQGMSDDIISRSKLVDIEMSDYFDMSGDEAYTRAFSELFYTGTAQQRLVRELIAWAALTREFEIKKLEHSSGFFYEFNKRIPTIRKELHIKRYLKGEMRSTTKNPDVEKLLEALSK